MNGNEHQSILGSTLSRDAGSRDLKMKRLIAVFLLVLVLVGCDVSSITAGWPRGANETTCEQWTGEMTEPQRLAMAGRLLRTLRIAPVEGSPEVDKLVPAFLDAITEVCSTDAVNERDLHNITRVGFYVYKQRKEFRP